MQTKTLNFHGVVVEIKSPSTDLLESIAHDFHVFLVEKQVKPDLRIQHHASGAPQSWRRMFRFGRSRFYWAKAGVRRVCFFDKAWVEYSFDKGICELFSTARNEAYEACYFVILSFVGEKLDQKGLHRVHGLGLASQNGGTLFLAASGTGKSTLALDLLQSSSLKILSDDTPLVSEKGEMFSFAQRIALKQEPHVPGKFVRTFTRSEYGEKFVVGSAYFERQVQEEAAIRKIVLLERRENAEQSLETLSRAQLALKLLRWLAIGHETPQIAELFLRFSPRDIASRGKILMSRLKTLRKLSRLQGYRLVIGNDRMQNLSTVEGLV